MKTPSFGIYANQSDKRWNTFIEEMNERFNSDYDGDVGEWHYGIDHRGLYLCSPDNEDYQTIITLDDYFAEGSVYRCVSKPTFKRGDRILVWNGCNQHEAIEALAFEYLDKFEYPVLVIDPNRVDGFNDAKLFGIIQFENWKPLPKENPERQKLQQEIEQLEKELEVKRDKLKGL